MQIFTTLICSSYFINNVCASLVSPWRRNLDDVLSSPTTTAVPLEDYNILPENEIMESYPVKMGYKSMQSEAKMCGSLSCSTIHTRGDGHCFYHAMTLSIYYGHYKRRYVPTADKIITEMVKRLLSDVIHTFDVMPLYYPGDDDLYWAKGLSSFNDSLAACEDLGVKQKATKIYKGMLHHNPNDPGLLKHAHYVDLVCRYRKISDHRHSSALSIFRALTYIPGIDEIRDITHTSNALLTGTEICVLHESGHSSGLDCSKDMNSPQRLISLTAEISYENDPKFDYVHTRLVGSRIRCGHRVCIVLAQPNRQFSYFHAVYTSAEHTDLEQNISVKEQTDTWINSAVNRIFMSKVNFNKALGLYVSLITHSASKELLDNGLDHYKEVLKHYHIENILEELRESVEIDEAVELQLRQETDDDLSRHMVFSIYCFINDLGVFIPAAELLRHYVKMSLDFKVRECLLKQNESPGVPNGVAECTTENAVTGAADSGETLIGHRVSIVSTIIKLEQTRPPEVHYFGTLCDT